MNAAIVDTGPLLAFFDRAERHHNWIVERFKELDAPLLVCEPVLTESMHLLARSPGAQDTLLEWIENGALTVAFQIGEHIESLRALVRKYSDQPMSLADACIVRTAEMYERHAVLTLDSDFLVYRKNGRTPLTLIYPSRT